MKKILTIALAIVIALALVGCGTSRLAELEEQSDSKENTSMFIEVEQTWGWKIVYHRETKVMYAVSDYGDGQGVFTVLVNPDGSPMLWKGK